MVDADPLKVERALSSGGLGCPVCAGVLHGWGWARSRTVRGAVEGVRRFTVRCRRLSGSDRCPIEDPPQAP